MLYIYIFYIQSHAIFNHCFFYSFPSFCRTLVGVGYVRALSLIKKHGCIEEILKTGKYRYDESTFQYEVARKVFMEGRSMENWELPSEFSTFLEMKTRHVDERGLNQFLFENSVSGGSNIVRSGYSLWEED
jgi:hypothetical protein